MNIWDVFAYVCLGIGFAGILVAIIGALYLLGCVVFYYIFWKTIERYFDRW